MKEIDFFYSHLKQYYQGRLQIQSANNERIICQCCERPINETIEPESYCVASVYGKDAKHCLSCQLLFEGNKELLGAKSKGNVTWYVKKAFANKVSAILNDDDLNSKQKQKLVKESAKVEKETIYPAKVFEEQFEITSLFIAKGYARYVYKKSLTVIKDKMTYLPLKELNSFIADNNLSVDKSAFDLEQKSASIVPIVINAGGEEIRRFGMLSGAGMLITKSKLIFYVPGEHFQNFAAIKDMPFELKPIGGGSMILDVIKEIDSTPALFINSFGVKKANLVNNLKLTTNPSELYICNDDENIKVNLKAFNVLFEFLTATNKKTHEDIFSLIRNIKNGKLLPSDISDTIARMDNPKKLADMLKALPIDPHEALSMMYIVKKAIEGVK